MHTEISPWIEKLSPYRLVIALGAAFLALVVALAWVGWRWSVALDRMEIMQRQAAAGFLQAPTSSRTVRIDLRNPSSVSIGGGDFPERVDFLVNARTPRFARFRVSLLRDDGTLLLHADQLVRDSNMDLRFSAAIGSTNTCNVAPNSGNLGITGARLIAPGNAANSLIYVRMSRRDLHQMPPLASNLVDTAGATLIQSWINAMNASCQ